VSLGIFERSAILALTKIMCISNTICTEHIQLIFDLTLTKSLDLVIRCNLVVAIGDLYQRHANLIEDYIKKLY
jgi:hypothetical protein